MRNPNIPPPVETLLNITRESRWECTFYSACRSVSIRSGCSSALQMILASDSGCMPNAKEEGRVGPSVAQIHAFLLKLRQSSSFAVLASCGSAPRRHPWHCPPSFRRSQERMGPCSPLCSRTTEERYCQRPPAAVRPTSALCCLFKFGIVSC